MDALVGNITPITASTMQALFDMPREYMTYAQLAELLQVHRRTIERWVCLDQIPNTKLGKARNAPVRFKRTEIATWLHKQWSSGK